MTKFVNMTRDEAISTIMRFANYWIDKEFYNVTELVFDMIYKWNDANPNEHEIFGCEYDHPNINNGYVCGFMVEDDVFIFNDYIDEWNNL